MHKPPVAPQDGMWGECEATTVEGPECRNRSGLFHFPFTDRGCMLRVPLS